MPKLMTKAYVYLRIKRVFCVRVVCQLRANATPCPIPVTLVTLLLTTTLTRNYTVTLGVLGVGAGALLRTVYRGASRGRSRRRIGTWAWGEPLC